MTAPTHRVVFDCNVLLQAVLNPAGPAFRCLTLVEERRVELLASEEVLAEAHDVLHRPEILRRNPQVTPERIAGVLEFVGKRATFVEGVPRAIMFPRDPKDAPYLNLAVAGQACYLVTRDSKHLLRFALEQTPEATEFRARYPNLRIIDTPTFLNEIDLEQQATVEDEEMPSAGNEARPDGEP